MYVRFHECPNNWEYNDHANHHLLPDRCKGVLIQLRAERDPSLISQDTRPIHGTLFKDLTPPGCPYFAGNYRGADLRCLKYYQVCIPADPRVGAPPEHVTHAVNDLAQVISQGLSSIDIAHMLPVARLPQEERIYYLVTFACRVFVEFLRIHPYANGNGHMARFIIWSLLGKYGLWPKRWPLNDRPPDPPYSQYIKQYRDGQRDFLEKFVLKCILGDV